MDYGDIDRTAATDKLVSDLTLDLYEVAEGDLEAAVHSVVAGDEILKAIHDGVQCDTGTPSAEDDFGAPASVLKRETRGTWTLVILSDLKLPGATSRSGSYAGCLKRRCP